MKATTKYVHNLTVTLSVVSTSRSTDRVANEWEAAIGAWLDNIKSAAIVVSIEGKQVAAFKDMTQCCY